MTKWIDTPVAELCKRALQYKGQSNKLFKVVLDNKTITDLVKFLNTEKQMGQDHVDSLGNELFNVFTNRTYYSPNDPKGRGGQPYELQDTGEYWNSFKVLVREGRIVIESNPFKGLDNIEEAFGQNLEGLTDENLQLLINEALNQYIQWYEREILR